MRLGFRGGSEFERLFRSLVHLGRCYLKRRQHDEGFCGLRIFAMIRKPKGLFELCHDLDDHVHAHGLPSEIQVLGDGEFGVISDTVFFLLVQSPSQCSSKHNVLECRKPIPSMQPPPPCSTCLWVYLPFDLQLHLVAEYISINKCTHRGSYYPKKV